MITALATVIMICLMFVPVINILVGICGGFVIGGPIGAIVGGIIGLFMSTLVAN